MGGGLLPRRFTLTADLAAGGGLRFLWHYLSTAAFATAARVYLRPDRSYVGLRPMEFGLSSRSLRHERFSALPEPITR